MWKSAYVGVYKLLNDLYNLRHTKNVRCMDGIYFSNILCHYQAVENSTISLQN